MVKKALHTQKTACNGIGRLEGFGFQFVLAHALYGQVGGREGCDLFFAVVK